MKSIILRSNFKPFFISNDQAIFCTVSENILDLYYYNNYNYIPHLHLQKASLQILILLVRQMLSLSQLQSIQSRYRSLTRKSHVLPHIQITPRKSTVLRLFKTVTHPLNILKAVQCCSKVICQLFHLYFSLTLIKETLQLIK